MRINKLVFTGLFLLLLLNVTFAQIGSISGVVTDNESGEKIPFASVSVLSGNSDEIVGGSVSSDKGKFKVEKLELGEYKIIVSFIGYTATTINSVLISDEKLNINLGQLSIAPSSVASTYWRCK